MRRIIFTAFAVIVLLLLAVGFFYYFPPYPEAYAKINPSMSQADVSKLLTQEGFSKTESQGISELWEKPATFGVWNIACGFDKGKAYYVAASFQRDGNTIRARSRNFELGQ
jgi:hypothetical protein